ncbi:MAG: CUAEP/CCAEP-tail radical SAM protein [Pseudomonadota bacterium]
MKVLLINPYELGRQPFGLAEPAAWLAREDCDVSCCDLSLQRLDNCLTADTDIVAIYVAMHTATRIAVEALPKIRRLAPGAHLCVYGLYAPMNEPLLRTLGVDTVIGGEYESGLVQLVRNLRAGRPGATDIPRINLGKTSFLLPDRSRLPALSRYASLILPDGTHRTVGFTETTRGCKYHCRHCPIVPVYEGRFFVVPAAVVLADIRAQVAAGAQHISFGDPDFFNGPGHALRIVRAMRAEFPALTFDATIKVEHLVKYPDEIRELGKLGCLFILSAVEALDDAILTRLDKGHTRADFLAALALMRAAGIDLAPTFVAFTPWTTLDGYIDLLRQLAALQLVEAVAPVQLSIRLLIPAGSRVLGIAGMQETVGAFDPATLGHPWRNPDARVDALQQAVADWITRAEAADTPRGEIFRGIWRLAWEIRGQAAPALDLAAAGSPVPRLSENWYCCAEPTCEQLVSF